MSRNSEIIKRLRAEAVERGLCYVCRCRFPRPGVRSCDECLARGADHKQGPGRAKENAARARRMARIVEKRRLAGLCPSCGRRPIEPGRASCSVCLDMSAAKAVRTRERAGGVAVFGPLLDLRPDRAPEAAPRSRRGAAMSDFMVSSLVLASEPCCPDFSKRVCGSCHYHVAVRLDTLARNLAVAGGLCAAWETGLQSQRDWAMTSVYWRPGCGQPVPR